MQRTESRDSKQSLLMQSNLSLKKPIVLMKQKWRQVCQRVNFKKAMGCNGLAKLRGRLKEPTFSNRAKASRINLFIFLNKPIYLACWCLLIELNFQTAHHRP